MPGGTRSYRLQFADGEPLALWIFVILALVNWLFSLALDMGAPSWFMTATSNTPRGQILIEETGQYVAPHLVCWYAGKSVTIGYVLIGAIIVTLFIIRKRIRLIYRGRRRQA